MSGLLPRGRVILRVRRRNVRRYGRCWRFYWPDEDSLGSWNLGGIRIDFGLAPVPSSWEDGASTKRPGDAATSRGMAPKKAR